MNEIQHGHGEHCANIGLNNIVVPYDNTDAESPVPDCCESK